MGGVHINRFLASLEIVVRWKSYGTESIPLRIDFRFRFDHHAERAGGVQRLDTSVGNAVLNVKHRI